MQKVHTTSAATGNSERFQSAAVLLRSDDYWVLQHREDKLGIAQPGAVGMWGGRKEDEDESPIDNALRELGEETPLELVPEQLERIARISYELGVVCVGGSIETRNIDATLFLGYQATIERFEPMEVERMEGQAALYVPLPKLFMSDPVAPLGKTLELDFMIRHLAESMHPVYEAALADEQYLTTERVGS